MPKEIIATGGLGQVTIRRQEKGVYEDAVDGVDGNLDAEDGGKCPGGQASGPFLLLGHEEESAGSRKGREERQRDRHDAGSLHTVSFPGSSALHGVGREQEQGEAFVDIQTPRRPSEGAAGAGGSIYLPKVPSLAHEPANRQARLASKTTYTRKSQNEKETSDNLRKW